MIDLTLVKLRPILQNHPVASADLHSIMGLSQNGKYKGRSADTPSEFPSSSVFPSNSSLSFPDKTRGVLNEGGTFGERQGWHLPGFDTSSWETRSLSSGLPNSAAGVGFFVTTFNLAIPSETDVPISFNFVDSSSSQPYRAYLFVNGWMMGKRVGNLGYVI